MSKRKAPRAPRSFPANPDGHKSFRVRFIHHVIRDEYGVLDWYERVPSPAPKGKAP